MKVICFGDSNTYGYDPRGYFGGRYDADSRWVDILATETGWTISNMGQNGRERHGRKFCVSGFRQTQEYRICNVHDGGLFPLMTAFPGEVGRYVRRLRRECRTALPEILREGDQPTPRSAKRICSWLSTRSQF